MEPEFAVHPKLDSMLSRLERVRRNGAGYIARCPAHADDEPSLSVALGEKWVIFHCHAGCAPDDIRKAARLEWSDLLLSSDEDHPRPRRRTNWRAVELESLACAARLQNDPPTLQRLRFKRGWAAQALALLDVGWDGWRLTLPVREASGKLHDVLRYDPFATGGRKILAGRGKSRLPWPAPERVDTKEVLFLVEGEGTAISMLSVGLWAVALPGSISKPTTSVTSPGRWRGAGWHPVWAQRFSRFRNVVCLPDCDAQGRALMMAARYDLERASVPTRIIDLEPASQDGRDVADILLRGAYDGPSRKAAKNVLREIVAEEAELLVA